MPEAAAVVEELETETPPEGTETVEPEAVEVVEEEDDEDEDLPDDVDPKVKKLIEKQRKNNAENRKLRERALAAEKALEPLQAAAKAKAQAEMTDLEKANARIEELTSENGGLKRETAVLQVSARYDLPERVLAKLEGTTAEELLASADEWAKDLGIERKDKAPRRTKVAPAELAGGRNGDAGKTATLSEQIAAAELAKDYPKARALKSQLLFNVHAKK